MKWPQVEECGQPLKAGSYQARKDSPPEPSERTRPDLDFSPVRILLDF